MDMEESRRAFARQISKRVRVETDRMMRGVLGNSVLPARLVRVSDRRFPLSCTAPVGPIRRMRGGADVYLA
jgi:hypothetical protein